MPVLVKQAAFTIRIEARHAAKSTKSNAVGNWECWHCRGKLNWIVYSSNLVCSRTWFGTNPLWLVTTRSVASNQSRMFTVSLPRTISTTFLKSVRTHRPHKITHTSPYALLTSGGLGMRTTAAKTTTMTWHLPDLPANVRRFNGQNRSSRDRIYDTMENKQKMTTHQVWRLLFNDDNNNNNNNRSIDLKWLTFTDYDFENDGLWRK